MPTLPDKTVVKSDGSRRVDRGSQFILRARHGGGELRVPLCCGVALAVGDAYRLAAVEQNFGQALVPECVLEGYRHHHATLATGDECGQTGLESRGTNPYVGKASFRGDPGLSLAWRELRARPEEIEPLRDACPLPRETTPFSERSCSAAGLQRPWERSGSLQAAGDGKA